MNEPKVEVDVDEGSDWPAWRGPLPLVLAWIAIRAGSFNSC